MSKSVPQLTPITTLLDTDLVHVVRSNIDYKMTGANLKTAINGTYPLVYKALLSQNAPVASKTSGTVPVGSIWAITTFVAGDDFSNWELISGTGNTTGDVYRALTTAPTTWTNASDLSYDGAPYIVSTNANGDFSPFVNTVGDIVFTRSGAGQYLATLAGAFPVKKVICPLFPLLAFEGNGTFIPVSANGNPQDGWINMYCQSVNEITIDTYDMTGHEEWVTILGSSFLFYIEVYP